MSFRSTNSEELIHMSSVAMNASRDEEAMELLATLLKREPEHVQANYLLAAQHAQLGMLDLAEAGFRKATALAGTDFPMPRFQLGQLLMVQGRPEEAVNVLLPLAHAVDPALRAYANAFIALAAQQVVDAIAALHEGLQHPQSIPVLADDMRRLAADLERSLGVPDEASAITGPAASMLLSNYQKH
jgi:Flp pilus assembly protein TadD, contains TPR repeats